jgi:hypothetical protein
MRARLRRLLTAGLLFAWSGNAADYKSRSLSSFEMTKKANIMGLWDLPWWVEDVGVTPTYSFCHGDFQRTNIIDKIN